MGIGKMHIHRHCGYRHGTTTMDVPLDQNCLMEEIVAALVPGWNPRGFTLGIHSNRFSLYQILHIVNLYYTDNISILYGSYFYIIGKIFLYCTDNISILYG